MSCLKCIGCQTRHTLNLWYLPSVNLLQVRYRKPRWVPKAQSKIYKVREPTPIDPVEYEKMKEWTQRYNTERKSLQRFLHHYNEEVEKRKAIAEMERPFSEVFKEMELNNEKWNIQTGAARELDMQEREKTDAIRGEKLELREQREKEAMRRVAMEKVKYAQEWTFITEENLDAAIEDALLIEQDYEFALTLEGEKTSKNKEE